MHIPVIRIGTVHHVGTMDPSNLGSSGRSQEGHCLSVSPCPHAWRRIARLGGRDLHRLTRPEGAFLDVVALLEDPDMRERVVDWAVAEGLAERVTLWRAHAWDDEADAWRHTVHETSGAAMYEADLDGEHRYPADVPGPDGRPGVEEFVGVAALPPLAEATGLALQPVEDATDAVAMAWAREVASPLVEGGLDGVWWRWPHEPGAWLAPKAGIFPERVAGWEARRCPWASVDDGREMARVPGTAFVEVPEGPAPR